MVRFISSCFVIDFESKEVLLVFDNKEGKWTQPRTIMEEEETPIQACKRAVSQNAGIDVSVSNTLFDTEDYITPIDSVITSTTEGKMIDIQYMGVPTDKEIAPPDGTYAKWFGVEEIQGLDYIDQDIKFKVKKLHKLFKNDVKQRIRKLG